MLRQITVKNFAIVEDMHAHFGSGLNVITGETGSGKSLLVNAISLLLGQKADSTMVRKGADRAVIEGVFDWEPPEYLQADMANAGIEPEEDGTLILSREVTSAGRSTCRVNSRAVPVNMLARVGMALADLHGQHQHQALLRKSDHTEFLDLLGPDAFRKTLSEYTAEYRALRDLLKRRRELEASRQRDEEERDMLSFRVDEIEKSVDSEETFEQLKVDAKRLESAEEISEAAYEAWREVSHSGYETSALNRLASAAARLDALQGMDPRIGSAHETLCEAETILQNAAAELRAAAADAESNPDLLKETEDRIIEIKSLLKKNRCETVSDLLRFRDEAVARITDIDNRDTNLHKLSAEIHHKHKQVAGLAKKISGARRKHAAKLNKRMKSELAELAMPGATFEVRMHHYEGSPDLPAGPSGAETCEFLVSANPGEDPMPLSKVASGGELSRIMLAFKNILSGQDPVPVLIFDEIDAGIGGVTANHVGQKLSALGAHHQVLTVTHLPQIAAFGETHITVSKAKSGDRTVTSASSVSGDERLREISRMLGDTGAENASINLARELIQNNGKAGA